MLREPAPGVYLQTREDIMSNQKDWCEYDPLAFFFFESKNVDFSIYPFWLTTDDGQPPQGFESLKEAMGWLKEEGIII